MIEIETLSVRFGGIKPIDRLTAALSAPVCGLIGPNGAGKTTLLNVISGYGRPLSAAGGLAGQPLLPFRRCKGCGRACAAPSRRSRWWRT